MKKHSLKSQKFICLVISVAVLFLLCSCSLNMNKPYKINFYAMNTYITMTLYGENAEKSAEEAKAEILRLEKLFAHDDINSDIGKINRCSSAQVSDETVEIIKKSAEISALTDSAADITVFPVVKAWGFTEKEYKVPAQAEISSLLGNVDYRKITVSENTVTVPENVQITLGCIATGYASNKAAQIIKEHGTDSAVLSLGGNVQTVGTKNDGEAWNIAISDPQNTDSSIGTLSVKETAVVTSGAYQQNFTKGGKTYHHIINPKTGYPSDSGLTSVTVVCSDGATADALSTALFVMGLSKGIELYKNSQNFEAVFVDENRKIYVTDGLKDSFTLNESSGYSYG